MKKLMILVVLGAGMLQATAQSPEKAVANRINTLKTGNSKDLLSSFVRVGIDNLLGSDHKYSLSSTFFAVDSLLKGKNTPPRTYQQERKLRQTAFNFALTGDSTNSITKIAGGFTFSLLNRTNVKLNSFDQRDKDSLTFNKNRLSVVHRGVIDLLTKKDTTLQTDLVKLNLINKSWNNAIAKNDLSALDPRILAALANPELIQVIHSVPGQAGLDGASMRDFALNLAAGHNGLQETYEDIALKFARKPVLTFLPSAAYDRVNKQGEYSFGFNFTVGISKFQSKKPWELEAKTQLKIANDTALSKANYENKPWSTSLGVNKVLAQNADSESTMEFKFFAQLDHQFDNVPQAHRRNTLTLNSTYRVRVYKTLWLPVTLKFDRENHNLLGYFSITANL